MHDRYVLGFLFSEDKRHVLMIKKNRPVPHAELLNGVGGKIEPGESPLEAMCRECKEETDLDVTGWTQMAQYGNVTVFIANWRSR